MKKTLPLLLLVTPVFSCFAENTYFGLDYMQANIEVSDEKAKPNLTAFRLGTGIVKNIAIEAQYITSSSDDTINTLIFDLEESKGVYFVLGSGNDNSLGLNFDVSLGYAINELTVKKVDNSFINTEEYNGFSWGASISQPLPSFNNALIRLGYKSLYHDDALAIDTYSLGFTYKF